MSAPESEQVPQHFDDNWDSVCRALLIFDANLPNANEARVAMSCFLAVAKLAELGFLKWENGAIRLAKGVTLEHAQRAAKLLAVTS